MVGLMNDPVRLLLLCLSYVRSNLDDFNEVLEENFSEQDVENCTNLVQFVIRTRQIVEKQNDE